jgi:tRNA(His) guanylyltransferase
MNGRVSPESRVSIMKNRELFSNLISVPPVFIRLDGRAFHRLADLLILEKPFDSRFSGAMSAVCRRLVAESGLNPEFAYTFSDEISLYLANLPFSGRVEKIDSVAASFAASALTIELAVSVPVSFDARIVQVTPSLVMDYLKNRQTEAWRNHLNAYCQNALTSGGMSAQDAAAALRGISSRSLHEMMFSRGINLAKTPAWQRRGVLVYKQANRVEGYNPLTGGTVETFRSVVVEDRDLPVFGSPEGQVLVSSLVGSP